MSSRQRGSLWFLASPKWIGFHLLVICGIVGMANAGLWQLRRLDQRKQHNAAIQARYDEPAVALGALIPAGGDGDQLESLEWRPITADGSYLVDEQVEVVNRSQDGAAGWQALTPLRLADGRVLLVNRGFVPLNVRTAPAPTGQVQVRGHLRMTQQRTFGGLTDPSTGPLSSAQRIDINRLQPQFDAPLVPMYLELTWSEPDGRIDGLPSPVRPPDISEGSHLSYAIQWFCFSAAVGAGWVLAVRSSLTKRRERSTAENPAAETQPTAP